MPLPVESLFLPSVCLVYLDWNHSKQGFLFIFFFGVCAVSSPQFRSEVKLLNQLTIGNSFLEGEAWQAHTKCKNKAGVIGHRLCFWCQPLLTAPLLG